MLPLVSGAAQTGAPLPWAGAVAVPWWAHLLRLLRLLSLSKIGRVQDNNLRVQQLKLRLKTSTQSLLIAGLTLVYIFHLLGCMCAAPRPPTVPFSPPLTRAWNCYVCYRPL